MRTFRHALLFAASTAALASGTAQAQQASDAPVQADAATTGGGDEIVVTGTRSQGRSRLDTASPVDVLSSEALGRQGTTELGAAVAAIAPSIDFPRPSATDGTDAIRPATLRGLSPDQVLVLVNGVRVNSSALLNINGSVGRGSAAVDLNTIPTAALERIEVLRDGASAQYGSDAIAGVINLRLREARSGGAASATYGIYRTDIDTARGSRSTTGEPAFTASVWQGFGLGEDGFVTVTGEYVNRQATNRADFDPRVTPTRVTGRFGDPQVEQYTGTVNAGKGIGGGWSLYGWGSYQDRDTRSAAFPRLASATTALAGYPDGFLPIINTKSTNAVGAVGVKGDLGDWGVDLHAGYGRNKIAYRTRNSANYAYGAATPKNFYDGALIFDQWVAGLDVRRKFDVLQSLNLAFGAEGRREGYKITPGEPASYDAPATGAVVGASPGAQGFGGFAPVNAIERSRRSVSGYLDLEAQVTQAFLVDVAVRGEHYSDFGDTANGKLSARYDVAPWFALRGTVSTGFRAPSLQQQYFTSVAQVVQNGTPILTGTFPSTAPVAAALGGKPLQPEKSTNFSVGTVIRAGGFDLSVDAYEIRLRDQLGLSENIQASFSPQVAAILNPFNVPSARFFINGLRSRTRGIDAVAHYRLGNAADPAGSFDFTLAGNVNEIVVTRVPTNTATVNPAPVLFARSRVLTIEQGTPGEKVTGTIDWAKGPVGLTLRGTYYGDVNQPGTTPAADIHTGRHLISDFELRFQPRKGAQIALGASNLFDVYPDRTIPANNSTGVVGFPYYSPFGFNGRYLYARLGVNW
ncbi:TonB-dependent receptor [Sphingomonas sp. ABOLD]|uniref:TonB-dependent receptor plug domain-containing protein n=1 Tax=unclassified Sphingomonas TaxID=196159 RepID=UPI000F7E2B1D|nr:MULTISPECIES: TonB-dependent receptor [unclassified Sphingomonas]RSV39654.1 TonB-dependent receptor [Sphingomonas sp. ABOLE]RSV47647.1 TonB-dependent receptor [Sphingomonas sp. ABOLD]